MDQPAYALLWRCDPVTTYIFDTSVINCLPKVVSFRVNISKCAIMLLFSNLQPKTILHRAVLVAALVVSDIPLELVYPTIMHVKRDQLVHIHMYQVPFSMC